MRAASLDRMLPHEPIVTAFAETVDDHVKKLERRLKKAERGDPDGVHDARTWLRRVREDLVLMGESVFDEGRALDLEDELHAHEKALAKPRDSDVLIKIVREYLEQNPTAREPLGVLLSKLEGRRDKSLRKARRILAGARRTLQDVRALLKAEDAVRLRTPKDPTKAEPVLVHHFAHGLVWKQYEAVLAYDMRPPADPDVLHHFRSQCRRLRYGMEALGAAVPRAEPIVSELRDIQDRVGAMHDHHVAALLVNDWIDRGKLAPHPELAKFLDQQKKLRDSMRDSLTGQFQNVLAPEFRTRLESALDQNGPAAA
jgi:CHAD domain-containing protein